MKTVERWLASPEFQKFVESGEQAFMELVGSNSVEDLEKIQKILIEMGSRYNHLVFQVTEDKIQELKDMVDSAEEITHAVMDFIRQLEEAALIKYPKIMQIFLRYREKTKNQK